MNNQEGTVGIMEIDLEAEDKSGLNLLKRQVGGIHCQMELSLSKNARPLTKQGPELLKRSNILIGDTGATMNSSFCGAYGLNKRATTLSTTVWRQQQTLAANRPELHCHQQGWQCSRPRSIRKHSSAGNQQLQFS